MMTEITRDQAGALAALVAALRPEWDQPGILKALSDARTRGDAWRVTHAALYAAAEPTNRTPAVIPLTGDHWTRGHTLGTGTTVPTPHQPRCDVDGHGNELASPACRLCRAEQIAQADDHRAENPRADTQTTAGPELVRAAMRLHGVPTADEVRARRTTTDQEDT